MVIILFPNWIAVDYIKAWNCLMKHWTHCELIKSWILRVNLCTVCQWHVLCIALLLLIRSGFWCWESGVKELLNLESTVKDWTAVKNVLFHWVLMAVEEPLFIFHLTYNLMIIEVWILSALHCLHLLEVLCFYKWGYHLLIIIRCSSNLVIVVCYIVEYILISINSRSILHYLLQWSFIVLVYWLLRVLHVLILIVDFIQLITI
jgi:hypothetical protein